MREHYESGEHIPTPLTQDEDAEARIKRIITKISMFNRANPQQPLMLNMEMIDLVAGMHALTVTLTAAGVIDGAALYERKSGIVADMVERAWEQSAPDRRRATGLVVPGR